MGDADGDSVEDAAKYGDADEDTLEDAAEGGKCCRRHRGGRGGGWGTLTRALWGRPPRLGDADEDAL